MWVQNFEAVPGYTVDQIHDISHLSTPSKPNIVLINAGVNDCENGIDIPNIGSRLASLLDDLFKEIPATTLVVSTLIPGTDPDVERYRAEANQEYRVLVSDRRARGQKVVLAESVPACKVPYYNTADTDTCYSGWHSRILRHPSGDR